MYCQLLVTTLISSFSPKWLECVCGGGALLFLLTWKKIKGKNTFLLSISLLLGRKLKGSSIEFKPQGSMYQRLLEKEVKASETWPFQSIFLSSNHNESCSSPNHLNHTRLIRGDITTLLQDPEPDFSWKWTCIFPHYASIDWVTSGPPSVLD